MNTNEYGVRKEKKICTVSPLNQHDFVPFSNKWHSRCVLFESRVFRGIVLDCGEVCRLRQMAPGIFVRKEYQTIHRKSRVRVKKYFMYCKPVNH